MHPVLKTDAAGNLSLYQLRPGIGEEARMATLGNYAILFRVIGEAVRIERVTYGGRDLQTIFDPSAAD